MVAGAVVMTAGTFLALVTSFGALIVSRLIVGAGEALMMGAGVRWLLHLAGESRRGQGLGHIGLANYAGLTVGPLLAEAPELIGVAGPFRSTGVEFGQQALRRDLPVRLLDDIFDLWPGQRTIQPDAEPPEMPNVRRHEERIRVVGDIRLLHARRRCTPQRHPTVAMVVVPVLSKRLLVVHEERRRAVTGPLRHLR